MFKYQSELYPWQKKLLYFCNTSWNINEVSNSALSKVSRKFLFTEFPVKLKSYEFFAAFQTEFQSLNYEAMKADQLQKLKVSLKISKNDYETK